MINLMRSEFYKLWRSRAFQICCLVVIAGTLLNLLTYFFTYQLINENPDMLAAQGLDSFLSNVPELAALEGLYENLSGIGLLPFSLGGSTMQIILAIFSSIFIVGEFSSGTIKLNIARGYSRAQLYFSKYFIILVTAACYILLAVLTNFIGGCLLWEVGSIPDDFAVKLLSYLGTNLLLHAALAAFLTFVSFTFPSIGLSIAINVGVLSFYGLLLSLAKLILPQDFPYTITHISLMNQISLLSDYTPGQDLIVNLTVVSICYFLAFLGGGIYLFHKRDVK